MSTVAAATLIGLGRLNPAIAQHELGSQLNTVVDNLATTVCRTVKQSGRKSDTQVSAEVTAKVDGLFARFFGLEGKASGTTDSQEYQGVSQDALAAAIKDETDCRLHVFDTLIHNAKIMDRVLSSSSQLPPSQAKKPTPGAFSWSIVPYVVRCDIPIEIPPPWPMHLEGFGPANPAIHSLDGVRLVIRFSFTLALQYYGEVGKTSECVVYDNSSSASQKVDNVIFRGATTDRYINQGRHCVQTWYEVEFRERITEKDSGRYCQEPNGLYSKLPSD